MVSKRKVSISSFDRMITNLEGAVERLDLDGVQLDQTELAFHTSEYADVMSFRDRLVKLSSTLLEVEANTNAVKEAQLTIDGLRKTFNFTDEQVRAMLIAQGFIESQNEKKVNKDDDESDDDRDDELQNADEDDTSIDSDDTKDDDFGGLDNDTKQESTTNQDDLGDDFGGSFGGSSF